MFEEKNTANNMPAQVEIYSEGQGGTEDAYKFLFMAKGGGSANKSYLFQETKALLNEKKTGGIIPVYVAPALSSDGKQIAYISTGSLLRAEVFLDLYLADATTGKRTKRLTNSVLNPETEELRYVYSQSAFSPDGRTLAYTGMRKGKDVLFLLDLRSREVIRRLDGRKVVLSGFMLPLKLENGFATEFFLLSNSSLCCYGITPEMNEWIHVRMRDEGLPAVQDVPVFLAGKLRVQARWEGGYLTGIYEMDGHGLLKAR